MARWTSCCGPRRASLWGLLAALWAAEGCCCLWPAIRLCLANVQGMLQPFPAHSCNQPMQEGRQLGEPEALRIFLQIFQAMDYCHRRCVGGCGLGWVGAGACLLQCSGCFSSAAETVSPPLPKLSCTRFHLALPPLPPTHALRSAPRLEAREHPAGRSRRCEGRRLWWVLRAQAQLC